MEQQFKVVPKLQPVVGLVYIVTAKNAAEAVAKVKREWNAFTAQPASEEDIREAGKTIDQGTF